MLTPFDSSFAENYIADILHQIEKKQCPDAVAYICRNTLPEIENCTDNVSERLCYEVWTAACLLDAVINHTDYTSDCRYYIDNYTRILENIEEALQKTKRYLFFWKTPAYEQNNLLIDISDALLKILVPDPEDLMPEEIAVMPHDEEDGELLTVLGGIMQENGIADQWFDDIMDLYFRLSEKFTGI